MEPANIQSLLFVKVLGLKPGWKDSNFQVMKAKFSLVSIMVTTSTVFGKRSTACVLPVIVDKLADIKVRMYVQLGFVLEIAADNITYQNFVYNSNTLCTI